MTTTTTSSEHIPEIDWLKGLAILFVVWIHAKPFEDSAFFREVVNRGVPIFFLLFGISSEVWWQKQRANAPSATPVWRWWASRLRRILPGYWILIGIWWLAISYWRLPELDIYFDVYPELTLSVLTFAPWIGTSWFVSVIVQFVLIFPALRWLTTRIGAVPSLIIGALSTFVCNWFLFDIVNYGISVYDNVPKPAWHFQWVLSPRVLWHVVAGVFIARVWSGRISQRTTWIALLLSIGGVLLTGVARGEPDDLFGTVRALTVSQLTDVPFAIAALGILQWLPPPVRMQRALRWLGLRSWGIYIGHLLVHELIMLWSPVAAKNAWEPLKVFYWFILLACGIVIAVVSGHVDEFVQRCFRRARSLSSARQASIRPSA